MDPQTSLSQLLSNANTFFGSGLYEDALHSYQKALAFAPANADVHLGVAVSHLKLRQVSEGLVALNKALKLAPAEEQPRLRRGGAKVLAEAGAFAEAQETLAPLLRTQQENEDVLLSVRCQAESGATAAAFDLLAQVLPRRPNIWTDVLAEPKLSVSAREALLAEQERLLPLVREGVNQQKKAAVMAQITYLQEHDSSDLANGLVAEWEKAIQTLDTTKDLSEAIMARKEMAGLARKVSQALLAVLNEKYTSELAQLHSLTDHGRYTEKTLPEGAAKSSAADFLGKAATNEQARRDASTSVAAHEELDHLLSKGQEALPQWVEALVAYGEQHTEGVHLIKGQAIARELSRRFPDEVAVQVLAGRLGERREELKGKAITYGKWIGMGLGALLLLGLIGWGGYALFSNSERGEADRSVAGDGGAVESGLLSPQQANAVRAVADELWVREFPREGSTVLEGLDEGEIAQNLFKVGPIYTATLQENTVTDFWYKVKTREGMTGWVFGGGCEFVHSPSYESYPDLHVVQGYINDPDGYMNLREGPGTDANIITKIYQGQPFFVLSQTGNWWPVKVPNGPGGYMHRSRINIPTADDGLPPDKEAADYHVFGW